MLTKAVLFLTIIGIEIFEDTAELAGKGDAIPATGRGGP
jgi:hypothetical protein